MYVWVVRCVCVGGGGGGFVTMVGTAQVTVWLSVGCPCAVWVSRCNNHMPCTAHAQPHSALQSPSPSRSLWLQGRGLRRTLLVFIPPFCTTVHGACTLPCCAPHSLEQPVKHPPPPTTRSVLLPLLAQVKALEGVEVVQVMCGELHTAALTAAGELWTWGCGKVRCEPTRLPRRRARNALSFVQTIVLCSRARPALHWPSYFLLPDKVMSCAYGYACALEFSPANLPAQLVR